MNRTALLGCQSVTFHAGLVEGVRNGETQHFTIAGDDADIFLEAALHNWDFFVRAWYFHEEQAHHPSTAAS